MSTIKLGKRLNSIVKTGRSGEEAREKDFGNFTIFDNILFIRGAIVAFRKALTIDPNFTEVQQNLDRAEELLFY